jgi:hypothetical protein
MTPKEARALGLTVDGFVFPKISNFSSCDMLWADFSNEVVQASY